MNFLLYEMTFLRYFMPLIIEGNKRGIKSRVYAVENHKYTNPFAHRHYLDRLAAEYNFELIPSRRSSHKESAITFTVEGVGATDVRADVPVVALTYMTDFRVGYPTWINEVEHVVFPSENFAKKFGLESKKHLYLGSPKYDNIHRWNKLEICEAYGLDPSAKYCTIINPSSKYPPQFKMSDLIEAARNSGYKVIVKGRGKDRMHNHHICDYYVEDNSWFPHSTQQLLAASDIAINPESTSVKEMVMHRVPFVNIECKPHRNWLSFLIDPVYSNSVRPQQFDGVNDVAVFERAIECLKWVKPEDFDERINEYLFQGNSSGRILDALGL